MDKQSCQELFEKCKSDGQVSDLELQQFLTCKAEGNFDFVLVDIREMFEYTNQSIKGTDLLVPTSVIHNMLPLLEERKDKFIILYCRTGNRTGYFLFVLKRMGFENIAHLSDGITQYSGVTLKNAPLPNEI